MKSYASTILLFTVLVATLLLMSACVLPPQGVNASLKNTTLSANKTVAATPQNQTVTKSNQTLSTAKPDETKTAEKPKNTETKSPEGKLPTKFAKEGELISFPNLKAKDPEGDTILYTFSAPLNDKGQWQTKPGDAGTYKLRITASDGKNTANQEVILIVEERNGAPVLELGDIALNEGELARLAPKVTDPDGDAITLRYSGWMNTETRQTTFTDAGVYDVTVVATDGKSEAKKTIRVTVKNINRAPKLDALNEVIKIKEGDKVSVLPTAKDADGDKISFSYSAPLDTKGQWQTKKGDAGSYRVNVTANDGDLSDVQRFFINVETLNNKPTLSVEQDKITLNEGERVTIKYTTKDSDNDPLKVSFTGWKTTPEYMTTYSDAGTHVVTITVSDGKEQVSKTLTVLVNDVNRPPVFDPGAFQ